MKLVERKGNATAWLWAAVVDDAVCVSIDSSFVKGTGEGDTAGCNCAQGIVWFSE